MINNFAISLYIEVYNLLTLFIIFPMLHFAAFMLCAGLLWYFLPSRTAYMRKHENKDFLFRVVAHPDCPVIVEPFDEDPGSDNLA